MPSTPPILHLDAIGQLTRLVSYIMAILDLTHRRVMIEVATPAAALPAVLAAAPRGGRDPIDQFNASGGLLISSHRLLAQLRSQTEHRETLDAEAEAERRRREARAAEDAALEQVSVAHALTRHYVRRMVALSILSPSNRNAPVTREMVRPAFSSRAIDAGLARLSPTEHAAEICHSLDLTPDFRYWTGDDLMRIDAGGLPANPPPMPTTKSDGSFDLPPIVEHPNAVLDDEEEDPDPFWRVPQPE